MVDGHALKLFGSAVRSYDDLQPGFPWVWFWCGCYAGDDQVRDRTVAIYVCARHRPLFGLTLRPDGTVRVRRG